MVLEIPWLREENPVIDWRKETISLIEERIKIGMVSIKGLLNRNEKKLGKNRFTTTRDTRKESQASRRITRILDVFVQKEYRLPDHGP